MKIKEIDNRDSNETWLHLDDGNMVEIDFEESINIVTSFIENNICTDGEFPNDEVIQMVKKVYKDLDSLMKSYGIDIS